MLDHFEGRSIRFNVPSFEDVPTMVLWIQSQTYGETMGSISALISYNQAQMIAASWCDANKDKVPTDITFIVRNKINLNPMGFVKISRINWIARNCELSCFLSEGYITKGFGPDILLTSVRYIFEELNLERLYGRVFGSNVNSDRICSIVAEDIGVLKDSFYLNGRFEDVHVIEVSREAYKNKIYSDDRLIKYIANRYNLIKNS
ncbi:GNAT family N-acetyltransferase [Kosakonia oryzae]|uniref:GNAT family N-acetyltransferase n=1 Tax=Kosakonia oryzae TaxID=497725 RepID=UPI001D084995|nr:GNAT family protein [Kosakonia oryzae]UDJ82070.1 GNAT family N-acetyltransferase [Kosakonia oryzae]